MNKSMDSANTHGGKWFSFMDGGPDDPRPVTIDENTANETSEVSQLAVSSLVLAEGRIGDDGGELSPGAAFQDSSSGVCGFELRLILEFCDCGNLRQALDLVRDFMRVVAILSELSNHHLLGSHAPLLVPMAS